MKHLFYTLTLAALPAFCLQAEDYMTSYLAVSNVTLHQIRFTQDVEVTYSLGNDDNAPAYVLLNILTNGVSIGMEKIKTVSGGISTSPTNFIAVGNHRILWKTRNDWRGHLATNAVACVIACPTNDMTSLYMVVDLSGGTSAKSFPVSYTFSAPDPVGDESCITSNLWLKYVNAGTFTMGSPATELYRNAVMENQRSVTLTKPFYAGVFEVTRGQYWLVTGASPSQAPCSSADVAQGVFPVGNVSWQEIRGSSAEANAWPSSHAVDTSSFMGILRAKTGLAGFDLPTEAQWEYTCRAGTATAWNNGTTNTANNAVDANLDKLGWYFGNSLVGGVECVHPVGQKQPNAWNFYDMHGNLMEFCLDWLNQASTPEGGENPVGSPSGTYRVLRGGSYQSMDGYFQVDDYRSAWASGQIPGSKNGKYQGFRVFLNLE